MSISEVNISLFRMINDLGKEFTFLNPVFVFIAEYTVFLLLATVIVFWFTRVRRNRLMIISAFISVVMAEILARLVGLLHSNNQPFAELANVNKLIEKTVDNSFPSDHTIIFFAFCFTFFLFRKGFWWIIVAVLVAISRIWVGVHYPADVTVGAIIAIVTSILAFTIVKKVDVIKRILAIYEKAEQNILPSKNKSKNF